MSLFFQDGVWFTSLDYKNAQPDPLREFAENLVAEINTNNMEDITRFCNVYVDLDFQVLFISVFLDGSEFEISQACPS